MSGYHYLGLDPGRSGGLALITGTGDPQAFKMPETERDLSDLIKKLAPDVEFAVIEKVWAFPGYQKTMACKRCGHRMSYRQSQGSTSIFTFGMNYGQLRAFLIANEIPFEEVAPATWQKVMGCRTKGDKNVTKQKCQQLFPGIRVTHANADALLIAEYCRRVYGQVRRLPMEGKR